jgi:hypothetical protein
MMLKRQSVVVKAPPDLSFGVITFAGKKVRDVSDGQIVAETSTPSGAAAGAALSSSSHSTDRIGSAIDGLTAPYPRWRDD